LTACFMFLHPPYRSVIGLAAIILFAQALQQSLYSTLAGLQRFDRLALISIYVSLASVASISIAALLGAGVMGMLWATLGALLVAICFFYRDVDKLLFRLSPNTQAPVPAAPDPFRRIRKFSLTMSYILLLDAIVW